MHQNAERTLASRGDQIELLTSNPSKDDFAQPSEPAKYIWMSGETADRTELCVADEAFICGTGAEFRTISEIDRYQIGDGVIGPIAARLEQRFQGVVRVKVDGRAEWLTGVYCSVTRSRTKCATRNEQP